MKKVATSYGLFIFLFMSLITSFDIAAYAQKTIRNPKQIWSFAEDTRINPHDFTDDFYAKNGVVGKAIIDRRTGTDFLSVFSLSSDPNHTSVRVVATLPAYTHNGEIVFWYPLGLLNDEGFTNDEAGAIAKKVAYAHPIYVFPQKMDWTAFSFANNRQAALIDESANTEKAYFGVRVIVIVDYTPKAFTKEGNDMMLFMMKKNGASVDGTPIIKTNQDIWMLQKEELISLNMLNFWDDTTGNGPYAISPLIYEPANGVIAADAFLRTVTLDGKPLPSEEMFANQFGCLQKSGDWCTK